MTTRNMVLNQTPGEKECAREGKQKCDKWYMDCLKERSLRLCFIEKNKSVSKFYGKNYLKKQQIVFNDRIVFNDNMFLLGDKTYPPPFLGQKYPPLKVKWPPTAIIVHGDRIHGLKHEFQHTSIKTNVLCFLSSCFSLIYTDGMSSLENNS